MEEKTRQLDSRLLLVALAAAFAAVSIWAATALAAGGPSSSSAPATSNEPVAAYVHKDNGNAATSSNCPDEGGRAGASGSSSNDL
jgi:hypothetical protein